MTPHLLTPAESALCRLSASPDGRSSRASLIADIGLSTACERNEILRRAMDSYIVGQVTIQGALLLAWRGLVGEYQHAAKLAGIKPLALHSHTLQSVTTAHVQIVAWLYRDTRRRAIRARWLGRAQIGATP